MAPRKGQPGHPHSEASKRKIAEAHRGKPKGPQSEESKRKKSEALKGRTIPPEVVEKRRQALIGRPKSEAHKQKLREANLGKKQTEESNQKRREAMVQVATPEYRAKVSEGVKRAYERAEFREKNLALVTSPERLASLHEGRDKHVVTPEEREVKRQQMIERWKSDDGRMLKQSREQAVLATRASQEIGTSSLEVQVKKLLDTLGIQYEQQKPIGIYTADFFLPEYNLVLEIYGCYWHACPTCGYSYPKKTGYDDRRAKYIQACGYSLFILWEHDLKNDFDINTLIERKE